MSKSKQVFTNDRQKDEPTYQYYLYYYSKN